MARPQAPTTPQFADGAAPASEMAYGHNGAAATPDGYLSKGDRVTLVKRGSGPLCLVRDRDGRQVMTGFSGLRRLR